MSSIRPLLTITVLAAVGVVLYLKINDTEPQLPEGVADWSVETDTLDIDLNGMDGGDMLASSSAGAPFGNAPSGNVSVGGTAPAYTPTPIAGGSAPAYVATAPATTAPVTTAPIYSAPPILDVPGTSVSGGAASTYGAPTESITLESHADAGAASMPELPELPPFAAVNVSPGLIEAPVMETPTVSGSVSGVPDAEAASPVAVNEVAPITPTPSSLFSKTRLAVHAALDRGELSQALLLLSDWYDDPSLSASEAQEVDSLLGQLAGSVIYSTEDRLEPPYMVQAGERLETIAQEHQVPWQLLAKINGITSADQLQPGQKLKVIRGPFSALIDISQQKMTLMLDRRYAGQFKLNIEPSVSVEEGHWEVSQKLMTPASVGLPGLSTRMPTEERSLMLSSTSGEATQVAILRGALTVNPQTATASRELRLNPADASDIFDILSLGSKVVVRR